MQTVQSWNLLLPTRLCRLSIPSASCQLPAEWLLVMALFIYGMGRQESSLQFMLSHLLHSHSKLHHWSRQTCLIRMHSQVEYCQMHFVVVCIRLCIIWNLMVSLLRVWEMVQSGTDLMSSNFLASSFIYRKKYVSFNPTHSIAIRVILNMPANYWCCTSPQRLSMSANYCVAHWSSSCRFIDISRDQKLHLWKSDSAEISFSSLVSAICSCSSDRLAKGTPMVSSWIAAGLSSGYCRLLDKRSGNIIAVWRAHDGHITKVTASLAPLPQMLQGPCCFDIYWSVFLFLFPIYAYSWQHQMTT